MHSTNRLCRCLWGNVIVMALAGLLASGWSLPQAWAQAGAVDAGFNSGESGAGAPINALALQPNGSMVIGGEFGSYNGVEVPHFTRLLNSGALDRFFAKPAANGWIYSISLQANGRIVMGGQFTQVGSAAAGHIVQLTTSGSVDSSFDTSVGANGEVFAVATYPSGDHVGKVLVGGYFITVNAELHPFLARLNANGSLDTSFATPNTLDGPVYAIAVQPDDKVLIAGEFQTVEGIASPHVARLNADGSRDSTFDPGPWSTDSAVFALALQPDGKVLIGGLFADFDLVPRNYLARLNANGSLDTNFLAGVSGMNDTVEALALQDDGKILVGGSFTMVNGLPRSRFARLNEDGTVDSSITLGTGANAYVSALAVQPDGDILLAGAFTTFNGVAANGIARLKGGATGGNGEFSFTAANYTVGENVGDVIITVQRLGGLNGQVSVGFAATNGTAIPGTHYTPTNGVLTFAPGQAERTFRLRVFDDNDTVSGKNVELILHTPTGGAALGDPAAAMLEIINEDGIVGFQLANYFAVEGNPFATISLIRSGGVTEPASVDLIVGGGTAAASLDYTGGIFTVFFDVEQTLASIEVPIVDDTLVENSETVFLTITNTAGPITLDRALATLTIYDNDFGPGLLEFAYDFYSGTETEELVELKVVRRNGVSGRVSVTYETIAGSAREGLDFVERTNSISFSPGQTEKSIPITLINDPVAESNETFTVRLLNPTGGATLGRSEATVKIVDDEYVPGSPGRFEIDAPQYTMSEGDGTLPIIVRRVGGTNGAASVTFTTLNGSAAAPFDFRAANSLLLFAPGEVAKTVNIPIMDDAIGEGNEFFSVRLSEATNATLGSPISATITILENDLIPGELTFAAENYNVYEGDRRVRITVFRTNGLTGPVGALVTTSDNTAFDPDDYAGGQFELWFEEGQSSAEFTININNNDEVNENLTFDLALMVLTNATGVIRSDASVTILDDDYEAGNPGVFSFESVSYITNESAFAVRIVIVRQQGKTGKVDLKWRTQNGSAQNGDDFIGTDEDTVTFEEDDERKTITIELIGNEVLDFDRTFQVELLDDGLPDGASLGEDATVVTITDDDLSWGDIRLVALDFTVGEETNYAVITVGRYGANYGTVFVDYQTSDGTAIAGRDYTSTSGQLILPAYSSLYSELDTYASFYVPIHDDALTNGSRSLTLLLTGLSYLPEEGSVASLSEATATLTINDDELYRTPAGQAGEFQLSLPYYYQSDREGSYGSYIYSAYYLQYGAMITVTRTNGTRGRVMVDYEVFDPLDPLGLDYFFGGGFYGDRRGTLVFDDYQMSTNFFVDYYNFSSSYLSTNEPYRRLVVQLSNPRGFPGEPTPTLGALNTADLLVYNTAIGFNFVNAVVRVPEWYGDPSIGTGCQCVRLGVRRPIADEDVKVNWSAPNWRDYVYRYPYDYYYYDGFFDSSSYAVGRLQSGSDYALPPNGSYAGDYTPVSGTINWGKDDYDIKYIEIPINNDREVEFNEDFFVYLTIPDDSRDKDWARLGPVRVATVTILADDANRILDLQLGASYGSSTPLYYANEQPAGAVDLLWNRDNSGYIVEPNPPYNDAPGANNRVYALAVQPDGKVILGGEFTGYNAISRNRIARAMPDGGIDLEFDPGSGIDGYVAALALYQFGPHQGKIIVGGGFTSVNGQSRYGIARLNPDGSLDSTFRPGSGANDAVRSVAIQNDGKVLLAGDFTQVDGTNRFHVARLNTDGRLDTTFDPGLGANGPAYAVALSGPQPFSISGAGSLSQTNIYNSGFASGTIELTGNSQAPGSNLQIYFGGTLLLTNTFAQQQSFTVPFTGGPAQIRIVINEGLTNASPWSYAGLVIPGGISGEQIVIGGNFTLVDGVLRNGVARLNANGSLDLGFDTGGSLDGTVYSVLVQADRKVFIGGDFTSVNLKRRNGLARLDTTGRIDETFKPGNGFNDIVYTMTLQPDGRPLVGGLFTSYDSVRRMGIARILPNGSLDTSFMDAAYNQFAGVINPFSYDPPSYVSAIAHQVVGTNEYVFIGGSFTRVGGGYTRDDIRYRSNIARLVGGATPGPGNMELTMDAYGADESGSFANFTLRRLNGSLGSISANFVTGDITATASNDYVNTFGTALWYSWGNQLSDGDTRNFVYQVPVLDDLQDEGNETFSLVLTNPASSFALAGQPIPVGAALGRANAVVNIIDDDFSPGALGFAAPNFIVNEDGVQATITITRTNGVTGVVSVDYETFDLPPGLDTAVVTADYTSTRGTLSFASGQSNNTFTVQIQDDTGVEFDEVIGLRLSLPTGNASLGLAQATLTIVDNDFLPGRLNFASTNYLANEMDTHAGVLVSRSGGNLGALTVQVATSGGTAASGIDYVALTNTLVWTDGDSAPKTFLIPLINDSKVDPDETIQVRLFNASKAGALGSITNAAVTVADDDFYGTFAFSAPNFTANENGGEAAISVVRSDGAAETVTVDYFTTAGTTNNGDFTPVNGSLTFGDGVTAQSFTVPVVDDAEADGTKIVILSLTNAQPFGARVGFPNPASLTIIDNESANVPAGSVDTSFRPVPGVDGPVYALALEINGKVLVGGEFNFVNSAIRRRLARLLIDGTLDPSFDPGEGVNGTVRALAMQSDSKALVGGIFSLVNGVPRNSIARLDSGGTVDTSFNPGSGFDNPVYVLAVQRIDNQERVLVGGAFTTFNGVNRNFIARLMPGGELDPSFNPGLGANDMVFALAVQPDGKILIGGDFTLVNNTNRSHIARLNRNGSLDLTFNPGTGANNSVRAIAVQTDGKIVLGGLFTAVNGTNWNHIARLNANGSLDASFNPGGGADNVVYTLALQENGKILVGGEFTVCNGVTRNRITRLNPDGTVDPSINFGTGANSFVAALKLQTDGKFLIGGGFTQVNGQTRNRIARLHGGSLSGSGSLEFSASQFTVLESGINSVITVRRVGGTDGTVSVAYSTSPGTAGTDDYSDVSGALVFPPGETKKTFTVPVYDNQVVDAGKTVNLHLSNFVGATAGPQPTATLNIVNDDSRVGFETPTFSVNENALGARAVIAVTRTGSTNGIVIVDYTTLPEGTATPGEDYLPASGSLVFESGVSNLSFTLSIIDDTVVEGSETLTLLLGNPRGSVVLGQTNAMLTIVDNDFAPGQFIFTSSQLSVQENVTNAVVSVIRTNGSAGIVSARFETRDGTAISGLDYFAVEGTVTFADGQSSNFFTIPIVLDNIKEDGETIHLRLFEPTGGASLGAPNTAMLTIQNVGGFPLPGDVVESFDVGSGANSFVRTIAVQPDGRIVFGGAFTLVNGVPRARIARLDRDGGLDTTFYPGTGADNLVWCAALRTNGNVLLGGAFLQVGGEYRMRIAEMDSSGSVDIQFNPGGVNAMVYGVAAHGDGVVLGGSFNDTGSANLARFNADGSLDYDFNTGLVLDGAVHAVAVLPDHKLIVCGDFTSVNGIRRPRVARLNANGSLDATFGTTQGVNGLVFSVALQTSGQMVIGGDFSSVQGVENIHRVARLNADGSTDTSFNPMGGPDGIVYSVAAQPDGKVVVGGDFTHFNGFARNHFARLKVNGSLDQDFVVGSGADGTVYAVAVQPDEKIVIGGDFESVDGYARRGIAQLYGGEPNIPSSYRILSADRTPENRVVITVESLAGQAYALDETLDFQTWTPAMTNSATGATLEFFVIPSESHRFYRARRVGP